MVPKMKPYKIIKSKQHGLKKKRLVGRLKPPKVPFRLFKNVHPPKRVQFYFEDRKYEIAPSDVSLEYPRDGVKVIVDQSDRQQSSTAD
jgi:hypothetical protein